VKDEQFSISVLLALSPVMLAFTFVVFVFYRKKREAYFKQAQAELSLKVAEVELKALRSQINPHFIFNCLNSIHHYMHKNNIQLAGGYLVRFSQLIRYALETSSSRMVLLREDLDALRHYMELEKLRLEGTFDFEIVTEEDQDVIHIPPMMMQPFVENAIWHGLSSRLRGGKVTIRINRDQEMLRCIVEDNGENNKYAEPVSQFSKKTSLGMSLIRDRLEVISRIYGVDARFTMIDRLVENKVCGKQVVLFLPYES
jgi:LytS/YehU family sensor histidine kinase